MIRACLYAAQAMDTSFFPEDELRCRRLALRVVAPPTMKRTSLEKNGRPNTRPVVCRILGYIKNSSSSLEDPSLVRPLLGDTARVL